MTRSGIIITIIMVAATLAAAFLICGHYGLIPGLDFGAGQYYYTDIPGWEKYFSAETPSEKCPRWLIFLLFFAWGYAMYRLWRWIDSKR